MSILAGTPWTRAELARAEAESPDQLARLREAIPEGTELVLVCRKPGHVGVVLRTIGTASEGEITRTHTFYASVVAAGWAALAAVGVAA